MFDYFSNIYPQNSIGGYFTLSPVYIFEVISLVFLGMTSVSDRSCRENQNTLFVFNTSSPPPKILPFMR